MKPAQPRRDTSGKFVARKPATRDDGVPFDPEGYGGYDLAPANGSNVVVNYLNGLGLHGQDMSVGNRFVRPRRLSWYELEALHIDALGKRIAELPGHEATREGYQVRPIALPVRPTPRPAQNPTTGRTDNADRTQLIVDRLTTRAGDLELLSRLFEGRWRRRVYGSCLLVVGTEDCFERDASDSVIRTDFSQELRAGSEVLWIRTFDARYYRIKETYGEGHPLCGQPKLYEIRGWDRPNLEADWERGALVPATASVRTVHASRVWRDAEPEGWSIFDGLARELARVLSSASGAENALSGMAVPTFKITDLAKKLARDEKGVRDQIRATNQAKSLLNAILLGDGEEFEWQKLQLGGVSDIIYSLSYLLSAATGIPMTLLFGMSPGGFSGGESEERNWHNYVRSVQRELGHGVKFVLDLLLGEMGVAPATFPLAIEWNKLVVLTDLEAVELRDRASQYWTRAIDAAIVKPSEVRASAFGGEGFSYDITIDKTAEEKSQANLGATESTSVLALIEAYYAPGSMIPTLAARAYLVAIDPTLGPTAALIITERPTPPPDLNSLAGAGSGAPQLGAGAAVPAADDPNAPIERAPDEAGNTWRTAAELAAALNTTQSFIKRKASEGLIAARRGTGRHAARQYAQEHVLEALKGVETSRASDDPPPVAEDADVSS